jgi:hypothetical protein
LNAFGSSIFPQTSQLGEKTQDFLSDEGDDEEKENSDEDEIK